MDNQKLGIPRSVASRTFLTLADHVLSHPGLSRVIRTYMVPGIRMDLSESLGSAAFEVSIGQCPSLWLWPEPRDGQPLTNASQSATLNISARIYVASVDPLDAMDVWGLIEEVANPDSIIEAQSLAAKLSAVARWQSVEIGQPASVVVNSAEGPVVVAEGSISVSYRIRGYS